MLGVALRIAYRIGIHSESAGTKCTPLEGELRRRLWWSFKIFDTRIGELADYKNVALSSTWDCKIPLNLNDSDLRPEMNQSPPVQTTPTEAIFVVVRSELREYVRHTKFHYDFHTPALETAPKHSRQQPVSKGSELAALEKMIEDRYLKLCNPENPLHFMTIWMARAYLAKCRLVEHYSMHLDSSKTQTGAQRDAAVRHALGMLEADTKIMSSPLTKGYLWLVNFHFPLPAYIHVLQDLKRRPMAKQALETWQVVSDNFQARFEASQPINSPLFDIFAKLVHSAWEARLAGVKRSQGALIVPKIVSIIRENVVHQLRLSQCVGPEEPQPLDATGMSDEDLPMLTPMGLGSYDVYGAGVPDYYTGKDFDFPGQILPGADFNQVDLAMLDWDFSV